MKIKVKWRNVIVPRYVPTIVFANEREAIVITPDDQEAADSLKSLHEQIVKAVEAASYEIDGDYFVFEVSGERMKEFLKEVYKIVKDIGEDILILEGVTSP
ncbi:MAG: hypothetical protein QXV05_05225 [Candidatus Korarchaeum sp.]